MCYWLKKKGARQITGCSLLLESAKRVPSPQLVAEYASKIEYIVNFYS